MEIIVLIYCTFFVKYIVVLFLLHFLLIYSNIFVKLARYGVSTGLFGGAAVTSLSCSGKSDGSILSFEKLLMRYSGGS